LIDVSAKIADLNEVTPHSDVVWVNQDGWCMWEPRYELSATHCHVDVSWFPFDVQTCQLVFESWTLTEDELVIQIYHDHEQDILSYYMPSDDWILKCASSSIVSLLRCIAVQSIRCGLFLHMYRVAQKLFIFQHTMLERSRQNEKKSPKCY